METSFWDWLFILFAFVSITALLFELTRLVSNMLFVLRRILKLLEERKRDPR